MTPSSQPSSPQPSPSSHLPTLHDAFYQAIYRAIHSIYSFYTLLNTTFFRSVSNIPTILRRIAAYGTHTVTPRVVRDETKKLSKIPSHLAVILPKYAEDAETARNVRREDEIPRQREVNRSNDGADGEEQRLEGGMESGTGAERRYDDVADLVCWSTTVGVRTLTVYEEEGWPVWSRESLHAFLETRLSEYHQDHPLATSADKIALQIESSLKPRRRENVTLRLNLISASEGRAALVRAAKKLSVEAALSRADRDIKDTIIDAQRMERELSDEPLCDPQLLIVFRPKLTLEGFPPWHLRLTEIFHLPGNCHFSYDVFVRGLRRYAKCEMRFGR